jgi:hypothetical protein
MVLAAFASRSNTSPQDEQMWVRTLRLFGTSAPTAAALLAGVRWIDRIHPLPGACCLASEKGEEASPSGVCNALIKA